jgi:hypothetical protein
MLSLSLGHQHIVTQAFFRYGNSAGVAWFKHEKLANDLATKPWTVGRAMHAAQTAGVLTIEPQWRKETGKWTNNKFRLAGRFVSSADKQICDADWSTDLSDGPHDKFVVADAVTPGEQVHLEEQEQPLTTNQPGPVVELVGVDSSSSKPSDSSRELLSELEHDNRSGRTTDLSSGEQAALLRKQYLASLTPAQREDRKRSQALLDEQVREFIEREQEHGVYSDEDEA